MYFLRKFHIVVLFTCMSITSFAQTVAEQWICMPDEFVPYINTNQKKEMIESYNINVDSGVKNKFEGTTAIDTLTVDYGKFVLSEARDIQILRLPSKNDSIFCMIDTYKGPEAQSTIRFFDIRWEEISCEGKIQAYTIDDFIQKPDTMSVNTYRELRDMFVPELIEYDYDISTQTLTVSLSFPLLTADERNRLNAVVCKRTLKWIGERFK